MTQPDITISVNGKSLKSANLSPQIIAAGGDHSLAITQASKAYAWGDNDNGQLGNHTKNDSAIPIELALSDVSAIAAGFNHNLALLKNGSVLAWGRNFSGQLGNNSKKESQTPVTVDNLTHVQAIAAGKQHSLALKEDGTVWVWGGNDHGQLGDGTKHVDGSLTPVQVPNLTHVTAIAVGYYHNLALKDDGTVWMWGDSKHGQDGNKSVKSEQLVPQQITSLSNITKIATRGDHCLAVASDGTVKGWGNNKSGQLGTNAKKEQPIPVDIPGLSNIIDLAAGKHHTTALMADGTVWAWGRNSQGQLGDGTFTKSKTPVQVSNISDVTAIVAGDNHNLAVKKDGTIWSWGDNDNGQLGNGDTSKTDQNIPVMVKGLIVDAGPKPKPADYDFGKQEINTTSKEVTINICNDGQDDLILNGAAKVSFLEANPAFTVTKQPDSPLKAKTCTTCVMVFNPKTAEALSATVVIPSNDPNDNPVTFKVLGMGVPPAKPKPKLVIEPAPLNGHLLDFGELHVGQTKTMSVTLKNQSDAPIDITGLIEKAVGSERFKIVSMPKIIAANSSETLTVSFTPQSGGDKVGALTLEVKGDDAPLHYQLIGKGVGVEIALKHGLDDIASIGWTYDFATVKEGEASDLLTITIENRGADDLKLTNAVPVTITGIDADSFVVETQPKSLIAPNTSTSFTVRFKPASSGKKNAVIDIPNNDVDENPCHITVDGTATAKCIAQPGHLVAAWFRGSYDSYGIIKKGTSYRRADHNRYSGAAGMNDIVSLGRNFYSVKADGTVWNGATSPRKIAGIDNVALVDSSQTHNLFLKKDGTVWSQGGAKIHLMVNSQGPLNTNVFTSRTPVQVPGLTDVVNIATGVGCSVALKADGTVWTWGYNRYGELGNGNAWCSSSTPIQVPNLTGVVSIAASDPFNAASSGNGGNAVYAVRDDGSVWAWGLGGRGAFGTGNITEGSRSRPQKIPGLSNIKMVTLNSLDGCLALSKSGKVWGWGTNNFCSINTSTQNWMRQIPPMQIPGLNNIVDLASNGQYSLAVDCNGTHWWWGSNKNRCRYIPITRPQAIW